MLSPTKLALSSAVLLLALGSTISNAARCEKRTLTSTVRKAGLAWPNWAEDQPETWAGYMGNSWCGYLFHIFDLYPQGTDPASFGVLRRLHVVGLVVSFFAPSSGLFRRSHSSISLLCSLRTGGMEDLEFVPILWGWDMLGDFSGAFPFYTQFNVKYALFVNE